MAKVVVTDDLHPRLPKEGDVYKEFNDLYLLYRNPTLGKNEVGNPMVVDDEYTLVDMSTGLEFYTTTGANAQKDMQVFIQEEELERAHATVVED